MIEDFDKWRTDVKIEGTRKGDKADIEIMNIICDDKYTKNQEKERKKILMNKQ